jgi:hypothetical protein
MKVLLRGLLVGAVMLSVGALSLELVRDRLEQSEALRQSLEGAVEAQLGAPLRAGPIEVLFWPAQLRLPAPVLELPAGARLALGETRVVLDVGSLLRASARLEGVSVSGPARLTLAPLELAGELRVELRPGAESRGWSVDADGSLASGGRFRVRGVVDASRGFEGQVDLEDLNGEAFASLLASGPGEHARLVGVFRGRLELPASGEPPTLRLTSPQADILIPPVRLVGPVALVVELPAMDSLSTSTPPAPGSGAVLAPGRFAIDASDARVEYAGGLTEASGRGASVVGRVVRGSDGRLRVEEVALKIERFRGERRATDAG